MRVEPRGKFGLFLRIGNVIEIAGNGQQPFPNGGRQVNDRRVPAFVVPKPEKTVHVGLIVGLKLRPPGGEDVDGFRVQDRQESLRAFIGGACKYYRIPDRISDDPDFIVIHAVLAKRDLDLEALIGDQPRQRVETAFEQFIIETIQPLQELRGEFRADLPKPEALVYGFDVLGIGEGAEDEAYLALILDESCQGLRRMGIGTVASRRSRAATLYARSK